jgi:hypothetical protein
MSDQLPAPTTTAPAYAPPMNTLAILALVLSFVVSIGGIVCGHLALAQIKRTGESGRELALAGLIVGYVFTGIGVLAVIASIVVAIVYAVFIGALLATYGTVPA